MWCWQMANGPRAVIMVDGLDPMTYGHVAHLTDDWAGFLLNAPELLPTLVITYLYCNYVMIDFIFAFLVDRYT